MQLTRSLDTAETAYEGVIGAGWRADSNGRMRAHLISSHLLLLIAPGPRQL